MISLKKYLDSQQEDSRATVEIAEGDLLPAVVDAYGSALLEMGNCSLDACPGMGDELKRHLGELKTGLSAGMSCGGAGGDRHRRAGADCAGGAGVRRSTTSRRPAK